MYQQNSGALDDLTQPGQDAAHATGINSGGTITGYVDLIETIDGTPHVGAPEPAFWTASGGAVVLNGDGGEAVAVNAGGTIVGEFFETGSSNTAAVMWNRPDYAPTILPGLECDHCVRRFISASAINDAGIIVGRSDSTNGTLAVEWQSGTVTSLGALTDSGYSAASGINNSGDIVGASTPTPPPPSTQHYGFEHAFLYHQGVMTDLGILAGDTDSSASSINDKGQVVGTSIDAVDHGRAFLYQNGQIYDLNTLLDPTSPLVGTIKLKEAVSINSKGWIAANGSDTRDNWTHAFLLIPSE